VGSIGVVSAGFGFDEAIGRIGVSRRVYTSGTRKGMLDPFQPEQEDDIAHLRELQKDIHDQFIAMVKHRRGTKLKEGEELLFSGAFWTGRKGIALGLADREGELRQVLEERFGKRVDLRLMQPKRGLFGMSSGQPGVSVSGHLADAGVEAVQHAMAEKLERSRYGL
ncbi:MAG: S49 family peptidase, partial [Alphaproteobacteria bacterium]|nr:S49 family peptidase [Alphaproteobacteria bacterium]